MVTVNAMMPAVSGAMIAGRMTFDITMLKEQNRYRVVASVGSDGKTYIKDGKVVATGAENPWQRFCGAE